MKENEFEEWKRVTRQESLEKGYEKVCDINKSQNKTIGRYKKALLVTLISATAITATFYLKGFIRFSEPISPEIMATSDKLTQSVTSNEVSTNVIPCDTLYMMGVPDNFDSTRVIFCVQIGAYSQPKLKQYKGNLTKNIAETNNGTLNPISIGMFAQFTEAEAFLVTMKQLGLKDAFIIAVKNGRRVKI